MCRHVLQGPLSREPVETEGNPGAPLIFLLMPQESQAIPLVSVASVASGRAKKQVFCGTEERLEKAPQPQDPCTSGMAPIQGEGLSS